MNAPDGSRQMFTDKEGMKPMISGGKCIKHGMVSSAGRICEWLHRAIVAPFNSQSLPSRKILLVVVAATLFVFVSSKWLAVSREASGEVGHRNLSTVQPRPPAPALRRPAEKGPANASALIRALTSGQPESSLSVPEATAAPTENSPQPPPRRRLVLFWTTFWSSSFEAGMQGIFPPNEHCDGLCELMYNRNRVREADALLFHAADVGSMLPDARSTSQLWVLFNVEPPTHGYVSPAHDRLFNLTMTYRSDSDIEVGYGHTEVLQAAVNRSSTSLPQILPPFLAAAEFAKRKPYAYWMVSNCNKARMAYVRELAKHIRVDIFGKCAPPGSRSCTSSESGCEAELSATYAFYLAFENSLCPDNITEKLWRTLASPGGAIPVVIGAPPSRYAQLAPPGSFVHAKSFATPRELAAHLTSVASSLEKFASYHQWREHYLAHVGLFNELATGLCRLCELMQSDIGQWSRPAKADLYRWFSSGCETVWPIEELHNSTGQSTPP